MRALLLIASTLLLLAGPALAWPGDGQDRTKEEWEKQRDEERKQRQKKLREHLKGKSPQEQEEILKKLKELERKAERERLRAKQRRYEEFRERLLADLASPERARYERLKEDRRRSFVLHFMRRTWEAGSERFNKSLDEEERALLDGTSGLERRKRIREITDRRVLAAQTLEVREELKTLTEAERKTRLWKLRAEYIEARTRIVERDVVFPEAEALLSKPEAEIEKYLDEHPPSSTHHSGHPPPEQKVMPLPDPRAHHRPGFRIEDSELHELLHKIPEKHWKKADEEYLRIVTTVRSGEDRDRALEQLKSQLRKLLAD